jgi:DNA mismatch repair ATPase MutS
LREYFFLDNGKILDRFKHKGVFHTLRGQVNFFKARLGNTLCFIRVGKFYELYGADARLMAGEMKLNMREKCRRMACGIGFPAWRFREYISLALASGHDVAVIDQGDMQGPHVLERYVSKLYKSVE